MPQNPLRRLQRNDIASVLLAVALAAFLWHVVRTQQTAGSLAVASPTVVVTTAVPLAAPRGPMTQTPQPVQASPTVTTTLPSPSATAAATSTPPPPASATASAMPVLLPPSPGPTEAPTAPPTASSATVVGTATVGGAGTYTIQPGDTLSDIALRLGVSQAALAKANGITAVDHIEVGTVLQVPTP